MNERLAPLLDREHAAGQAVRYLIVGASGYLFALALFALEIELGISPYAAVPTVFVANGVYNFVLFQLWSFPAGTASGPTQIRRFTTVAGASLLVNYTALFLLYEVAGMPPVPSQAIAVALAAPVGFLGNRLWTFA